MLTTADTYLEPGDRFEVYLSSDARLLDLPASLLDLEESIEQLIGPEGQPLTLRQTGSLSALELASPLSPPPAEGELLWLEYVGPGQFRLVRENATSAPAPEPVDSAFQFTLNPQDQAAPREHASLPLFALAREAA